jgi:hypothetical protein
MVFYKKYNIKIYIYLFNNRDISKKKKKILNTLFKRVKLINKKSNLIKYINYLIFKKDT